MNQKIVRDIYIFFLISGLLFSFLFVFFNGRALYRRFMYDIGYRRHKFISVAFPLPLESGLPLGRSVQIQLPKDINFSDNTLIIPKIDLAAPVVFSQSIENSVLLKDLEKGVIWYPSSIPPPTPGNIFILGHSSALPWYRGKYGSVFALLDKLNMGDQIIILYHRKPFLYKVTEVTKKPPSNFSFSNSSERSHLFLISCWPIGTNRQRIVVEALLVGYQE